MTDQKKRETEKAETIQRFASRLTRRITLVVLLTLVIINFIVYLVVKAGMNTEAEERYESVMNKTTENIRRMMSDIYVATENSVHDVERDLSQPDSMYSHVSRIVKLNPTLTACGILLEADYYPTQGHWFGAYARRDSSDNIHISQLESALYDYLSKSWYIESMAKDEGDWMAPYFDAEFQELQATYAVPLRDKKGHKVGLLTSDISLEWLRERLDKNDHKVSLMFEEDDQDATYSFIIDRNGMFVVHPEEKLMLKDYLTNHIQTDESSDSLMKRLLQGNKGSANFIVDNVPSMVFWHPIKHLDWTYAIVVPQSTINLRGLALNLLISLIIFLSLIAIYILCRFTIHRTSRPLTDYAAHAASVEKELHIASSIQMSMLPEACPHEGIIDATGSLVPAKEVGGDLFDYFVRDNQLFFCIGDVSGKGIPASLIMAMNQAIFRFASTQDNIPLNMMKSMNTIACHGNKTCMFATLFLGVLDLATGLLHYCNAGHERPLLISFSDEGTTVRSIPSEPNLPIGIDEDFEYVMQEEQIAPGTLMLLFTDGLTEATNNHQQLFGIKRIEETILSTEGKFTPQQLLDNMTQAVRNFVDDAEQSDDLTMLAIRYS